MKKIISLFALVTALSINSASYSQVNWGNVISFNGWFSYASTTNEPFFNTNNGTVEFWVKKDDPYSQQAILSKNRTTYNVGDMYMFFTSSYVISRVQYPSGPNEIDLYGSSSQFTDTWHHVAYSWGSTGLKLFIDGNLVDQDASTYSAMNNNYDFYIGAHGYKLEGGSYTITDFLKGEIEELRIWDYQRSQSQIQSLMYDSLTSQYYSNQDSGIVGYWKFDSLENLNISNDGTDDVRDYSLNHNHLDLTNATLINPTAPPAPILISALPGNNKVTLNWTHSTPQYIDYYRIFRNTSSPANQLIDSVDSNLLTFIDTTVSNGITYYYRIQAIDILGIESNFSNEKNATPNNLLPIAVALENIFIPNAGRVLTTDLTFSSAGSYDPDGTIEAIYWYVNDILIGQDSDLNYSFPQGTNDVKLVVEDDEGLRDSSLATVNISTFIRSLGAPLNAGLSLLGDSTLYAIGSGGAIYKLDIDGNTVYNLNVNGDILSSSSIAYDSTIYVGSTDYNLYAFSKYGTSVWPPIPLGGEMRATATVDSFANRIYMGVSNNNFIAVDRLTGQVKWNYFADEPIVTSAVVNSNRILIFSTLAGTVYGIDLENLAMPVTPAWIITSLDLISTSPAVDEEGYFYYGTNNGKLKKISMQPGVEGEVIWEITLGGQILASPVIDGSGRLYIGSTNNNFYSVNISNGLINWTFNTDAPITTTSAISNNGRVYFANTSGNVFAIDTAGNELWHFNHIYSVGSSLLHHKGTTYIGTLEGEVVAIYDYDGGLINPENMEIPVWGTFQGNNQRTGVQKFILTGIVNEEKLPTKFDLYNNFPNPFNPSTIIKFDIPKDSQVRLEIFNLLGELVETIFNGDYKAGSYQTQWDAKHLSSGVYIYKLSVQYSDNSGSNLAVKKMILMK